MSLDVGRGEAVVVIGPSGSGKTTLLRCINFLEEFEEARSSSTATRSAIEIDKNGRRTRRSEREIAASRSNIGIVFQSYNLFPHMSVLRNITAGAHAGERRAGRCRRGASARASWACRPRGKSGRVPDAPLRRTAAAGGDRPRAGDGAEGDALRRITSALDPELVGEVLSVMRQLIVEGLTMVVVTHEMQFARDVANRVVFMDAGTIVEQGPPKELFANPSTDRLRAFLSRFREAYLL